MSRIVVGLSGGVDSSVAAYLLKKQGHEVIGCRMRTFDTSASLEEEKSAAMIAEKLGIPLFTEDFREEFRKDVIGYFAAEYGAGRTPNPCCICNRKVKWQALMRCMKREGAEYVATGHYAAVEKVPVRVEKDGVSQEAFRYAVRSTDSRKDQSYALYNLTQEEIASTVFPLSGMDKDEVRTIAREAGLLTAEKPDSMEICFIPENDYAAFLKEHFGFEDCPGNFVDEDGKILGQHPGIVHMTVGQRKGLGIALGKKVFVKEIRPRTNEVVLADDCDVFTQSLRFSDVNLQAAAGTEPISASKIKIRYADPGTPGTAVREEREEKGKETGVENGTADGKDIWRIDFERPVRAVTPGQAVVLYDADGHILAGGTIL